MKKISAILAFVIVFTMTIIPASAGNLLDETLDLYLTPVTEKVEPGDKIKIDLGYEDADSSVGAITVRISFDPTLISVDPSVTYGLDYAEIGVDTDIPEGNVFLVSATKARGFSGDPLDTLQFEALEGVNGKATFTITEVLVLSDVDENDYQYTLNNATATITIGNGGSEPDPKPEVFTVDKAVEGNAVKVTVANAAKAEAGKIYVATFNGEVLVDCIEKTIADGTLDFTGLKGDINTAKMFVWNNNNVPIEYATTAQ